ncbi:hypothetical protein PybrP1_005547 [[Pythium] brassicae (nom. inval.)]|nr:hypothetical protein PybrP1_005547 [[Pythium] brassicae (nom. inval.)]
MESIPFGSQLIAFMKDVRREEKKDKTSAAISLFCLLQRFVRSRGFSPITPIHGQVVSVWAADFVLDILNFDNLLCFISIAELEELRDEFSIAFWREHAEFTASGSVNIDGTGIYMGSPPKRTWPEKGGKRAHSRNGAPLSSDDRCVGILCGWCVDCLYFSECDKTRSERTLERPVGVDKSLKASDHVRPLWLRAHPHSPERIR